MAPRFDDWLETPTGASVLESLTRNAADYCTALLALQSAYLAGVAFSRDRHLLRSQSTGDAQSTHSQFCSETKEK
jgi:hypothetical protein